MKNLDELPTIMHLDEANGELVANDGRRFTSDAFCMLLDEHADAGGYGQQSLSETYGPWLAAVDAWSIRQ